MPSEEQALLWVAHVRRVSESLQLDEAQDAFLRRTVTVLPSFFETADVDYERLDALRVEAQSLLGREKARSLFAVLGPLPERFPTGPVGADAGADAQADCSCSRQSDWCDAGSDCLMGGCRQNGGCGTLWLYLCDGLCYNLE